MQKLVLYRCLLNFSLLVTVKIILLPKIIVRYTETLQLYTSFYKIYKYKILIKVYDNDYTSIINIYLYETFSTLKALALHSLDTLSDIRIKALTLLFLLRLCLSQTLTCLVLLLSVVNNFKLITSISFNYLAVIIVSIAFESSVLNLI